MTIIAVFALSIYGVSAAKAEVYPLYAGQDILVGTVIVSIEGDNLCIRYELSAEALAAGCVIKETHLAVGHEVGDIPQTKKGSPIPGHFPYGDDKLAGVDSYEECISFEELGIECEDTIIIAAHAVVCCSNGGCCETAWGAEGEPGQTRFVEKGNWATYFGYTVYCGGIGTE